MKNKTLPIIAVSIVVIAILIVIFIPKEGSNSINRNAPKSTSILANLDEEGNVIINKDSLSKDKITFLKYSDNSKIELIAILGENDQINVAFGTCQSCNGSPQAYYTQSGKLLKCNNCGLTFPLDVIGTDGTGCHPILIDEAGITETENGIKISKDVLMKNESLFSKVAAH